MPSLFAVTAAAHRAAGTHGAWIVGAVVLALLVGMAWNAWRKPRELKDWRCTQCLKLLAYSEVTEEFDLVPMPFGSGNCSMPVGYTCHKCKGEAVPLECWEADYYE